MRQSQHVRVCVCVSGVEPEQGDDDLPQIKGDVSVSRKRARNWDGGDAVASEIKPGSQYAASCASTQKRESVHKLGCIPGKAERQTSSTMTSPCAPRSPSRSTSMEDWEEIVRRGRAPRRP